MADAPLVSVIVPNYNYGRVLGQCLRALQAQTYSPLEIVLVDDRSTDDSVAVAESLGVDVISPSVNSGVSAARNLGADHANGEILLFLDSDIALAPDAVANAVALLSADQRIGAVCGNFDPVPLVRDSLVKEYRNLFRHYYFLCRLGSITGFLPTSILAMPAKVWAQVGPFNTRLDQSEGADLGERLTDRYEVHLTDTVRGRHDDDQNLRVALRKIFVRTRVQIPFFLQPRYAATTVGSPESRASLAATLTAVTAPLPLLAGPWALVPAVLLGWYLAIDRRMYRFVFAQRGVAFGVFFTGLHFLANLTIAAGAATGIAKWLVSPSFRRLYERVEA
jgi:glycosyltransferase involved in cell wall biosynthesis